MAGLHDSLRYVVVIFVNAALYYCPNEHVIIINDRPARPTALWCGHCYTGYKSLSISIRVKLYVKTKQKFSKDINSFASKVDKR